MFEISKTFEFSASHKLKGLPFNHPCARLHGHNYVVRVELTCDDLDEVGFVFDYGRLAPVKAWIDEELDHRHLNDVLGVLNPTAEHLAARICEVVQGVCALPNRVKVAVAVSETPKTWARYTP